MVGESFASGDEKKELLQFFSQIRHEFLVSNSAALLLMITSVLYIFILCVRINLSASREVH